MSLSCKGCYSHNASNREWKNCYSSECRISNSHSIEFLLYLRYITILLAIPKFKSRRYFHFFSVFSFVTDFESVGVNAKIYIIFYEAIEYFLWLFGGMDSILVYTHWNKHDMFFTLFIFFFNRIFNIFLFSPLNYSLYCALFFMVSETLFFIL